jgi:LysM repeat protein
MELLQKKIHMNKLKTKTAVQLTFDDDFNVPDMKPDIMKIIREQGNIVLSEVRAMNGKVLLKGSLSFQLLYLSENDVRPIHSIQGEIPFEEIVHLDEAGAEDQIRIRWNREDFSVSLINSRKISAKAIVTFYITAEEHYDEEAVGEIEADDAVCARTRELMMTNQVLAKKDTLRVREEFPLPAGKPNIGEILYDTIDISNVSARLLGDKLEISGDIGLFVIYTGEDGRGLSFLEGQKPFQGTVEINHAGDGMVPDLEMMVMRQEVQMKPDLDGEERIFDMEAVLNLELRVYENEQVTLLEDVYAVDRELVPERTEACYENMLMKNNSSMRIQDRMKLSPGSGKILELCHVLGEVQLDEQQIVEDGIHVEGVVQLQLLYLTDDDFAPVSADKGMIPFEYTIEVRGISPDSVFEVRPSLEQVSAVMTGGEEAEVKLVVNLDAVVFDKIREELITAVKEEEMPEGYYEALPGMVGYVVSEGDSLWTIGKKFHMKVEELMEMNERNLEEVKEGEKILIVKQVAVGI